MCSVVGPLLGGILARYHGFKSVYVARIALSGTPASTLQGVSLCHIRRSPSQRSMYVCMYACNSVRSQQAGIMVVIAYGSTSFPMLSMDRWKRTRIKEKMSVERLDEIDGEAGRLLTKGKPMIGFARRSPFSSSRTHPFSNSILCPRGRCDGCFSRDGSSIGVSYCLLSCC